VHELRDCTSSEGPAGTWAGALDGRRHVPALKERIGTQVQMIPESGGRSRSSGPGLPEASSQ